MFDRKSLKTRAKFVLVKSFGLSISACAIVTLLNNLGLISLTQWISPVSGANNPAVSTILVIMALLVGIGVSVFVSAPLKVGLKKFMLRSADMEPNLDNLTQPTKYNYKNIVWVTFVKNLYITLWSLLGFIPITIGIWKFNIDKTIYELYKAAVTENSFAAADKLTPILGFIFLLTLIFMIPAFIKELQYSMVEYILAENPNIKRADAIRKSKEMMVGNKWAYVKLSFSFFGWYLVAASVCYGAGRLFLAPYIEATTTQMYLELSGQGKDYSMFDFINPFGGFRNDGWGNM